jgi:hypothetical protein
MWMKKPLSLAVLAATIGTVLLYGLPFDVTAKAVIKGATEWSTIEVLLVFYSITYLQRMMEKRKNLSNAHAALNGLFNNNRINASMAPFLLGMLPAASTVLICGPIVRESTGNYLKTEEKACVTSYYRHISELFLPTYTSIFIGITMTEGRVTTASFVFAMIPMAAALMAAGWVVYLRKVPKDTGMVSDKPKRYYLVLLLKSVWTIALTIILILTLNIPVEAAVLVCIVLNIFINRFTIKELIPFFRTAFELKLMISTWLVMIFKEVLGATGVISALPEFFSQLPIPGFLVFALIFFFGTVVAGTQAIIVLCMPMAMASISPGHTGLALFVLLMSMTYVAMQVSPIHICLLMCAEDYGISLGALIKKTTPLIVLFTIIAFAYYAGLNLLGF